jgi:hypothetical protein
MPEALCLTIAMVSKFQEALDFFRNHGYQADLDSQQPELAREIAHILLSRDIGFSQSIYARQLCQCDSGDIPNRNYYKLQQLQSFGPLNVT